MTGERGFARFSTSKEITDFGEELRFRAVTQPGTDLGTADFQSAATALHINGLEIAKNGKPTTTHQWVALKMEN